MFVRKRMIFQLSSFSTGRYASTQKEYKNDRERVMCKTKETEKFKPRSLTTPMTFKQWKIHGPRLYEKRLRFLMKAGNVRNTFSLKFCNLFPFTHFYIILWVRRFIKSTSTAKINCSYTSDSTHSS